MKNIGHDVIWFFSGQIWTKWALFRKVQSSSPPKIKTIRPGTKIFFFTISQFDIVLRKIVMALIALFKKFRDFVENRKKIAYNFYHHFWVPLKNFWGLWWHKYYFFPWHWSTDANFWRFQTCSMISLFISLSQKRQKSLESISKVRDPLVQMPITLDSVIGSSWNLAYLVIKSLFLSVNRISAL